MRNGLMARFTPQYLPVHHGSTYMYIVATTSRSGIHDSVAAARALQIQAPCGAMPRPIDSPGRLGKTAKDNQDKLAGRTIIPWEANSSVLRVHSTWKNNDELNFKRNREVSAAW